MDKLKEYLIRHKADLDVDSPAVETWEYIASAKSRSSRWVPRYVAAACAIALAGVGIWLVVRVNKPPVDTTKNNSGRIIKEPAPGNEKIENTVRKEENTAGKDIVRSTSKPKRAGHKARSQKQAEFPDEIDTIDKSYSSLIDHQLRKLRATPLYAENGSYFSFYIEQFKQMDQDEQAVRNHIKAYGLTNEFLEQLINVYQQKLNVLKNLQTEINKMNNKVREKQAPSGNPEVHYLNI